MSAPFCVNCKYYREPKTLRWWELFTLPNPYEINNERCLVNIDPVSGERTVASAHRMRSVLGDCGKEAKLFEPLS
jgi:hypothetical protein